MPTGSKARKRPGSPLGRALDSVLQNVYKGNIRRFALALGISRSTVYKWLYEAKPHVERAAHRQAIAYALTLDVQMIDALIVAGLGYKITPFRPDVVALAVLASRLDADDVAVLDRQAQAMLRRDAQIRDGRTTPRL